MHHSIRMSKPVSDPKKTIGTPDTKTCAAVGPCSEWLQTFANFECKAGHSSL